MGGFRCASTTTLGCFRCFESPRMFGDVAVAGLVIDGIKTKSPKLKINYNRQTLQSIDWVGLGADSVKMPLGSLRVQIAPGLDPLFHQNSIWKCTWFSFSGLTPKIEATSSVICRQIGLNWIVLYLTTTWAIPTRTYTGYGCFKQITMCKALVTVYIPQTKCL